jgi:glycosyltransferase involved in cell wall biosynthesis
VRLAAALRGMRYAYLVQDIEAKYQGALSGVLNFVCRLTYRDPRIVAANSHLRQRLLAEYGRTSASIDIGPSEVFFTEPVREAKRYDVIYFLRRESWKGLDRFQRFIALAAGRLTCLCVSQDESLFELIERAGVTCRKPANDDELIRCIDSARVLFLTSYHEGFALPPLECMARGVPAVLFRCGGPDLYIVDGRNSFYVENEQQALETIERLLEDSDLYARTSREAVASAGAHRMDSAMRELKEHLQRL